MIRMTCPICAEPVNLRPQQLKLTIPARGNEQAIYAFNCPHCDQRVSRYATPGQTQQLITQGVPAAPVGPITWDDIREFREALTDIDCLAGLDELRT